MSTGGHLGRPFCFIIQHGIAVGFEDSFFYAECLMFLRCSMCTVFMVVKVNKVRICVPQAERPYNNRAPPAKLLARHSVLLIYVNP